MKDSMTLKFGPNGAEVEKFIENIKNFYPEEIERYNEIYDGYDFPVAAEAYDAMPAYDAFAFARAAEAAYDAMPAYNAFARAAVEAAYDAMPAYDAYFLKRGAFALALKPLVGTNGLTQEHYDLLTEICTVINFEATEEEVRILAYRSKMQFTLRALLLHPKATEDIKIIIALKLGGN